MERAGWSYPPGDLRVSDADRDQALSELGEAFRAGRITADEFEQRSGDALGARTGKQLVALLADLPVEQPPAPVAGTSMERAHRLAGIRILIGACGVAAATYTLVATAAALNSDPTLQQREYMQQMMARQGFQVPQGFPSTGFHWVGTIVPGTIAVLLVVLIVFLGRRLAHAKRA